MRIQIIVLFLTAIGCRNAENHEMNEVDRVNEVILQLIEADNRSDITAVLGFYTKDVEFHPKDKTAFSGIDKVEENYTALFKDNKLNLTTTISRTQITGDVAIVKGINSGTRTSLIDSTVYSINDRYEAHLTRDDKDTWKISKLYWSPIDITSNP